MRARHEDSRGTKRSISLLPGQATDIAIPENARQLTSEEILDVGRGRSFYLMGWIVYSDAMDNKRTLAFCRKWDRQSKRFYVVEDPDYEHAD